MSDIPHPLVKIPNKVARDRFVERLYGMGFGSHVSLDMMQSWIADDSYVGVFGVPVRVSYASVNDLARFSLDDKQVWSHPLTIVNSPSQFIAYLARAGIKPQGPT